MDKRTESQFSPKDESAETTRHIVTRFPALLTANALDRLHKEEGYEFPISGDEMSRLTRKKK